MVWNVMAGMFFVWLGALTWLVWSGHRDANNYMNYLASEIEALHQISEESREYLEAIADETERAHVRMDREDDYE